MKSFLKKLTVLIGKNPAVLFALAAAGSAALIALVLLSRSFVDNARCPQCSAFFSYWRSSSLPYYPYADRKASSPAGGGLTNGYRINLDTYHCAKCGYMKIYLGGRKGKR